MTINEQDLVPILSTTALVDAVSTSKTLLVRQDRIMTILSYNLSAVDGGTAAVPTGYVIAQCAVSSGQGAGTTVSLVLPVIPETALLNLVEYFYLANTYVAGTHVKASDGSSWIVTDGGNCLCYISGSKFKTNTAATFSDLGADVVITV